MKKILLLIALFSTLLAFGQSTSEPNIVKFQKWIELKERTSPGVGLNTWGRLWNNTADGHIYWIDDSGNLYDLTDTGAGGTVTGGQDGNGFDFGLSGSLLTLTTSLSNQAVPFIGASGELLDDPGDFLYSAASGIYLNNNFRFAGAGSVFAGNHLQNVTDGNNAEINLNTTGTYITRNIVDANPALKVEQLNSSSTGDIISGYTNGVKLFGLTYEGYISDYGGTPSDGDQLTWVAANGRYEPQAGGGGGGISALTNGSGTTVGGDLTSVDLGGTLIANANIDGDGANFALNFTDLSSFSLISNGTADCSITSGRNFNLTSGAGRDINLTGLDDINLIPTDQVNISTFAGGGTQMVTTDNSGNLGVTAIPAGTVTSVGFTGGLISVATATSTPAFTVAGTSGGMPYFSSTSTWASSGLLAANALMIGGGAGTAPSTITTGTGVLTALGVNVGSSGAFVTNGGALGTPSSGTATNLTGTASGLTAGNVTTNANLTGDVTSVGNATAIASGVIVNADINASAAIDATKINTGVVDNTEFNRLNGVTGDIQTQFTGKQDALVNTTNIKSINGTTLLGSGDLSTGYSMQFQAAQMSPADASTQYIGNISQSAGSTANVVNVSIPKTGTVTAVYVTFHNSGVAGTTETSTINFRYDNTTNTAISTGVNNSTATQTVSNTGLSIAVTAGHYFEIQWACPTWATNPTNVRISGVVWIQ